MARSFEDFSKKLRKDVRIRIASAIQGAAVEITNGLVEVGPAWTGRFSSAWDVVPAGSPGAAPRTENAYKVYRYDRRNFPVHRYEKALEKNIRRFTLVNTSENAGIAIDRDYAIFRHPSEKDPAKNPVLFGFRPMDAEGNQEPSLRADVKPGYGQEKPNAMITAEPDWFITYSLGGGLSKDFTRGVTLGFESPGS
jgi:hypothetical protein